MSAKRKPGSGTPKTAADVRRALRLRFEAPAHAMFEEVGNSTGFRTSRHADAVAIGIWPSRGYEIEGVEIKVSRPDWLSELKNPRKADDIAKYCDRWWIAVSDEEIVRAGELPPTWGLLVLRGDKMITVTPAPKLEPEAAPRSFMAAILRRAHEGIEKQRAEAKQEGIAIGETRGPEEHMAQLARLQRDLDVAKKSVDEFEQASGLKISGWGAGNIGKAVDDLMKVRCFGHKANPIAELELAASRIESQALSAAETLRREAKVLKAAAAALGLSATEAAE